jgi:hypothetical protein
MVKNCDENIPNAFYFEYVGDDICNFERIDLLVIYGWIL